MNTGFNSPMSLALSKSDFQDPAMHLLLETYAALNADDKGSALSGPHPSDPPRREEGMSLSKTPSPSLKVSRKINQHSQDRQKRLGAVERSCTLLNEIVALPEPLMEHALNAVMHSGWKHIIKGVESLKLDIKSAAEVELFRIMPTCSVPRHSHEGSEFTLVISGGFTDETGSFGPGELIWKGPEDVHHPVADPGEACYALAVSEGDIRLTGYLGIIQKIFKF